MKKFAILLLVATGIIYGADNKKEKTLKISQEIFTLYEGIVATSWNGAEEQATEPLTGTVPNFYRQLKQLGVKKLIENPAMVKEAKKLWKKLNNEESTLDEVKVAIEARKTVLDLMAKTTSDEQKTTAWKEKITKSWQNELKMFSIAGIKLFEKEVSEDFVASPLITDRILANNGKKFNKAHEVALGGGTLAILVGFDRRRKEMGTELFNALVQNPKPLESKAHETLKSIEA